jgi:Smr domain
MKVRVINLEEGRPRVDEALGRLAALLRAAKQEGFVAMKIIHGYGSSGTGGGIKKGVLASLARRRKESDIRAYVAGENWRISNETAWEILKKCPPLKSDSDLGRGNRGITIVLL